MHGAAEEGDAPVPQGVEMTDGKPGTIDQVALDADAFQRNVIRADGGNRHILAEPLQRDVQVIPVSRPDASREQHAVHTAADQFVNNLG